MVGGAARSGHHLAGPCSRTTLPAALLRESDDPLRGTTAAPMGNGPRTYTGRSLVTLITFWNARLILGVVIDLALIAVAVTRPEWAERIAG